MSALLLRNTLLNTATRSARTTAVKPTVNQFTRNFSKTSPIMVKAGDAIPSIQLNEGSPGDKVDLSKELASGKGLILGVPAAFSPSCSESHIPGYINSDKSASIPNIFVVSVNDAFVMKAWGTSLDPTSKAKNIRYVADPEGKFVKAMDLDFDASALLGNFRSKRYALLTEDGKVKSVHVEPDNIGVDVSAVDKVL